MKYDIKKAAPNPATIGINTKTVEATNLIKSSAVKIDINLFKGLQKGHIKAIGLPGLKMDGPAFVEPRPCTSVFATSLTSEPSIARMQCLFLRRIDDRSDENDEPY